MGILLLATAGLLGIVGVAGACQVTAIEGAANSDGWHVCLTVHWSGQETVDCLEFDVILLDRTGLPVEIQSRAEAVTRTSTGSETIDYCYSNPWEGYYDKPPFIMEVENEFVRFRSLEFSFDIDAIVAVDEVTWGDVKSFFR